MRLTIIFILFATTLYCQDNSFTKKDFGLPVDIPIFLSGTFGELRGNHFHTGIDIKTQGAEGKNILAIEDGWISRIKISTSGYGKTVYITHPDGYISVYGHLSRLSNELQEVVKEEQYLKESFEVQMFFDENEILVEKGELIAYSGNTGGSMGPHLHFEIRDLKSQNPLNPLLFNSIKVKDYYRPKINMIAIYPVDESSLINGENDTLFIKIAGWGTQHRLEFSDSITVSGPVSFGISSHDLMNEVPNRNGVYSTQVFVDTNKIFDVEMTRLSFKTGRYINSFIDYLYYKKEKTRLVRTQIDTNNRFGGYKFVMNNGVVKLSDTLEHTIRFEIRDVYDNLSSIEFPVFALRPDLQEKGDLKKPKKSIHQTENHFIYHQKNSVSDDNISVTFPSNTFYQSFDFDFQVLEKDSNALSYTYKLHNKFVPAHKHFTIQLYCDTIADTLNKYSFLAYSENNQEYFYSGKNIKNGKQLIKSRSLGYYRLMVDTINPLIKPVNLENAKIKKGARSLKIRISDEETGVASFRATLNGRWILMEYEPKKDLLEYVIDENMLKGENQFRLEVKDLIGNIEVYESRIDY